MTLCKAQIIRPRTPPLPALWLTSASSLENGTASYTYDADGAQSIDDGTLPQAISGMHVQDGVTATAPASSLNDPLINAKPNIAKGQSQTYSEVSPAA